MGKKIISFSLYGKHPAYTVGAVANARHASRAYPGWVCRFYVADDVPQSIVSRLQEHGAEVVNMGQHFGHEAMFWRLYAAFEPENEIVIFRDTDSRFTKCELVMVNNWLASDKKFHVMRWDYSPEVSVMGGLWGLRGNISELREPVKKCLEAKNFWLKGADEIFLNKNLTSQMKGNVYVNELYSLKSRKCFIGETIHPFPSFAYTYRGKYLNISPLPVGMVMPSRRIFIIFSIYKKTPFSEFFLALWLNIMEKTNSFHSMNTRGMKIRFYVADNINPGLIERLRRYGRVILKPAKTVYDDDPQYWKLLILAEKNLGLAIIVDFWQFFFLVRSMQGKEKVRIYEPLPIEQGLTTGIRSWFIRIATLSICGPATPVSDIENLVARRDPNESYREFIRSTVYPRTSTTRMMSVLSTRESVGFLKGLIRILFPSRLYETARNLKNRIFSFEN